MEMQLVLNHQALGSYTPFPFSKLPLFSSPPTSPSIKLFNHINFNTTQVQQHRAGYWVPNSAGRRRNIRYDDEEEEEEEEEYGHNEEIAMLEMYTLSAREEALLVQAVVDEQQVHLLIFKGYSSSLSCQTAADPSRSVIPERGVIKSIDRIKGPFDPSNIQYLEKGLSWDTFKSRITPI